MFASALFALAVVASSRSMPPMNLYYLLASNWSLVVGNDSMLINNSAENSDTPYLDPSTSKSYHDLYSVNFFETSFKIHIRSNTSCTISSGATSIEVSFNGEPDGTANTAFVLPDKRVVAVTVFSPFAFQVVVVDSATSIFTTYSFTSPSDEKFQIADVLIPIAITAVIMYFGKNFLGKYFG